MNSRIDKKKTGILAVISCLVLLSGVFCSRASAGGVDAEVVWAQSDGLRYELYKAAHRDGSWSSPEKLTDDNADNLHPCIDTGPDGKKWLVWTAMEQGGYEIRYTFTSADGQWHEPMRFPSPLPSNIAPSLIVDNANVPWLVWSGNDGLHNDEIFFSRYVDGKWQKPALVNKANNVPDILPFISQTCDGGYEVTWQGYRSGQYVTLSSRWQGDHWGEEHPVSGKRPDDQVCEERLKQKMGPKVELPSFVPGNRQSFLRVYSPGAAGQYEGK